MEGGNERVHPVEKSLFVRAPTRRRDKSLLTFPPQRQIKPQDKEGIIFSRLMKSYNHLRDPMEEIIYPGLRQRHARNPHTHDKGVMHVTRNDPITVPTCCTMHKQDMRRVIDQHREYLYNSPTPTLPAINPRGTDNSRDSLEQVAEANLRGNRHRQLPYSTVVVRWRNSGARHLRWYNTDILYDIMSEFGPITSINTISPCSAYVVYLNLTDSCGAVASRRLGYAENRLYCHWLHQNMANKLFYLSNAGVRVRHDQYIQPTNLN